MINFEKLEIDILTNNKADIFDIYLEKFKSEIKLNTVSIAKGTVYYRGRKNLDTFKVAIDDFDTQIEVPFFKRAISEPPIQYAYGSRFNVNGVSYLYLTSDFETSMSEIRLKQNEICSIAEFKCTKTATYIDVTQMNGDLPQLYNMLMKPVIDDSSKIYKVTQFLSDIFKEMGYAGIVYNSTISVGLNVVCFYPEYFQFILYSEKAFKGINDGTGKITPVNLMDEFKRYPEYRKEMYSFGDDEEKEAEFEYIEDKIAFEDKRDFDSSITKIDMATIKDKEFLLNKLIMDFDKTYLRRESYQIRGAYYINSNKINEGIYNFIKGRKFCLAERDKASQIIIKDIFESRRVEDKFKNIDLKQLIVSECNLYFNNFKKDMDILFENEI
ncbi:RES domain [[Clostridium] sordellii]|uniref:RES family NAD+ phosphorylase n=1 Tax=Paraclostridium sordellii TaxID=1505 RepID=UPI0005DBE9A1|nr:RES family NAD+ phosphorylase [Paeniclostridium sordellii]CEQ29791.1 RES domain [[Clostridium] sordellii] [Paeniclostridium sordellii]